ncbi:hypothetical protein IQ457_07480 [Psychrobacter sp. M9-54-1]|uniref:hypothetical protein n=1 Tax=Psychrobacter sp. M9-54-1 TaxID=2782386 RepID=UPI00190CD5B8|nr:hypothetical protein [Psychrobacter sp. M9-54-1]MBK3393781.1 hypothetical protein [Psychrobacter sp. M9-54-1]
MSNLTRVRSDKSYLGDELACYLQSEVSTLVLPDLQALATGYNGQYKAQKFDYQLPLGRLQLIELVVYLPKDIVAGHIENVRKTAIESISAWRNDYLTRYKDKIEATTYAAVFDIQFRNIYQNTKERLQHEFRDGLSSEIHASEPPLQLFGWHDWQLILRALHTPCELWRFLQYRLEQTQYSASSHVSNLKTEELMINGFLNDPAVFAQAIAIDNALIKYKMQDKPNSALIAMALAQKSQSTTSQMYQQRMAQAAVLWSQMISQMLKRYSDNGQKKNKQDFSAINLAYWQQQILDESLFSRHELIRTLYRHPKQQQQLREQGYVVHHHSYESLGRHYMLIFYGQDVKGQHSKQTIQPNLAKIALDVATRLPIAELHHVIVLGIDFIDEANETFIDIDLWIQPVAAMSQRERQLTKQIQQLQQQNLNR